jgi:tetratricopeptide (TPR) repeat protein
VSVGLMLPALAWLVLATEGKDFFVSKRLLLAAVFAFVGLGIYLYLPLAAARSPVMNWGDPRTLQRIWWHVTGRQYQEFISFSPDIMGRQIRELFRLAGREFGPVWLPLTLLLAVMGLAGLFKRDRAAFWFLVSAIGFDVAYNLNYEIAEDKDAYYLPVFLSTAVAAGLGLNWLMRGDWLRRFSGRTTLAAAVLLSVIAPMTCLAAGFPFNNRSHYFIARDYVQNIFNSIEPGGMLLTLDWQVYSPMFYLREEEQQRPDLVAIDVNQLRRSWYFDYLKKAYPDTIERSRDKVEAFLEDLRHWEQDPGLFQPGDPLTQRISSRFNDMILSFVKEHIRSAPVYVTQDVATNRSGRDADLTAGLAKAYQFIPTGLVFKLETGAGFHEVSSPDLVTRGLNDGSIRFESDDVVTQKVLPVYATMAYNRGRYLAVNGRHQLAIDAYNQALAYDPNFSAAKQALAESIAALRKN